MLIKEKQNKTKFFLNSSRLPKLKTDSWCLG